MLAIYMIYTCNGYIGNAENRDHTQKGKYFSGHIQDFFTTNSFFFQDKYMYLYIHTRSRNNNLVLYVYVYNSYCIIKFLRKRLGKACQTELITV